MPEEEKPLLSTIYVDKKLGELLFAANQVHEQRPEWYGRIQPKIMRALETGVTAHRKGGSTSGQIAGLEKLILEIDDIKAGKH